MSTPSPDAARSALRTLWEQHSAVECQYPELHLRVVAEPQRVHLVAVIYLPGPRLGRDLLVIRDAVWQPSEVTQVSVVDWGRRALASWLAEQLESSEG